MKGVTEYTLHIFLVLVVLSLGAALMVLGNISVPGDIATVASGHRAERDYAFAVRTLRPRDQLSYDRTMQMIGGWGCTLRGAFPHSVLSSGQCW